MMIAIVMITPSLMIAIVILPSSFRFLADFGYDVRYDFIVLQLLEVLDDHDVVLSGVGCPRVKECQRSIAANGYPNRACNAFDRVGSKPRLVSVLGPPVCDCHNNFLCIFAAVCQLRFGLCETEGCKSPFCWEREGRDGRCCCVHVGGEMAVVTQRRHPFDPAKPSVGLTDFLCALSGLPDAF